MKFTCTQENLSQGLSVVARVASKSTNLPILNNILVQATKGGVTLIATNLEIGVTKQIRGKVEEEGQCTLPAKLFAEYISLLEDQTIVVEEKDGGVTIRSGNAETTLRSMPADDFPVLPLLEDAQVFHADAVKLQDALGEVLFAAATDDTRPEISGVLVHCAQNTLTLAATDSYRLAEASVPLHEAVTTEQSVIVPVRTLQEVARFLGGESESVEFHVTQSQISFSYDDAVLISRLIDGQYPDYQQIIPTTEETRVTVDTAELIRAVRATSLFSRPGINDIQLTMQSADSTLQLHSANSQVGEQRRSIAITLHGADNSIVLNSRYLLDGLTNLHTDSVMLTMTNNANPIVLRPTENEHAALYLIMPIKQ